MHAEVLVLVAFGVVVILLWYAFSYMKQSQATDNSGMGHNNKSKQEFRRQYSVGLDPRKMGPNSEGIGPRFRSNLLAEDGMTYYERIEDHMMAEDGMTYFERSGSPHPSPKFPAIECVGIPSLLVMLGNDGDLPFGRRG